MRSNTPTMNTVRYDDFATTNNSWTSNFTSYLSDVATTPAPVIVPASYYLLIRNVYFILNGIVVCCGLLFNSIALMVFASSATLRHTTTGHYLIALSLADSTYLSGDLFRWLSSRSHSFVEYTKYADLTNNYDSVCKLVNTIRYTAMLCSSSITVAITVERFLTIKCPLKIAQISTPKIAKTVIALITLVSTALCIFPIWCLKTYPVTNTSSDACQMDMGRIKLFKIMIWVSIRVMALILPSIIVTILTAWIIILLKERDREQYSLQAHSSHSDRHSVLERQLTIMLIAVAIAFVLLRLPYTIVWDINQFKSTIWKPLDKWVSYRIYVAYKLTDILAITNYAINFFLYFLCGSTFRKQLRRLFHCSENRPRPQKTWSIGTASSFMSRRSSSMYEGSIKGIHISQQQKQRKDSFELSQRRTNGKDNSLNELRNSESKT